MAPETVPYPVAGGGTIHDPTEVNERLAELGIPQDVLWAGLWHGQRYKATLTDHDTQAIRGIGVWNAMHRGLADASAPYDWIQREYQNFAVLEPRDGGLAIGVLAGNSAAGKLESGVNPSNAWPMSSGHRRQTCKRILLNRLVVVHRSHFSTVANEWPSPTTYFLVHHIDEELGEVRGELSLPTRLADGHITEWHERIILTSPDDLLSGAPVVKDGLHDEGDPIIVPIVERAV